jgi:hypothetical protein
MLQRNISPPSSGLKKKQETSMKQAGFLFDLHFDSEDGDDKFL